MRKIIALEVVSPAYVKLSLQEEACEVDPDTLRQNVRIPKLTEKAIAHLKRAIRILD